MTTSITHDQAPASTDRVAVIRRLWDEGQPADARAYLDQHPEAAADRSFTFELAFEEYAYRAERDTAPSIETFAARFPVCKSALAEMLLVNQWVEKTSGSLPAWPLPGQSILGFRVVRELGRGSFARVYLASESALGNRPVALKVSRRGGAEADILGRLRHDNIVPVYSVQEDPLSGMTLVCMPYLGGTTLGNVLDRVFTASTPSKADAILEASRVGHDEAELIGPGKTSTTLLHGSYVQGVVELGIQLADALAFVHDRKIYHRDLKPSNVLIRPDGRPMLLDFNLSFDEHAADQPLGGTPMYMAPEHLRAIDPEEKGPCLVDGRSDLFSLGVMLYEFLTGRHPFGPAPEKGNALTVVRTLRQRQAAGFEPVDRLNPAVDKKLSRIVVRCLALEPRDRFASAGDFAAALRECLATKSRRLPRPRILVAAAAAVLIVATSLTAVLAFRQPYSQRQYNEGVEALRSGEYSRAVGFFNRALEEDDAPKVRLARARAHLGMEDWQAALADLRQIDKLEPSGQIKAMLAYCCSKHQPPYWDAAIGYYKDAIKFGAASAVVHNNLGYCLTMKRGGSAEAMHQFNRAIELDPKFQLAYYQRALVDLKADDPRLVTREGLQAMEKTLELGPADAQLHLDAARLFALAQFVEPRWKELTLSQLEKALSLGLDRGQVERDFRFKAFLGDEKLQRLLRSPTGQVSRSLPAIQKNPDPFPDFGA